MSIDKFSAMNSPCLSHCFLCMEKVNRTDDEIKIMNKLFIRNRLHEFLLVCNNCEEKVNRIVPFMRIRKDIKSLEYWFNNFRSGVHRAYFYELFIHILITIVVTLFVIWIKN